MAFDSLSDKLQNVFKKLRSKGALREEDVQEAMNVLYLKPMLTLRSLNNLSILSARRL